MQVKSYLGETFDIAQQYSGNGFASVLYRYVYSVETNYNCASALRKRAERETRTQFEGVPRAESPKKKCKNAPAMKKKKNAPK